VVFGVEKPVIAPITSRLEEIAVFHLREGARFGVLIFLFFLQLRTTFPQQHTVPLFLATLSFD